MPSARLGKLEMPHLRGLRADTALRSACGELGLNGPHAQSPHLKNRGNVVVKSFVVLTAIVVLTLGNAIAAMPGAAGSVRTISAAEPIVTMADQELPFDRYWSKN